MIPRHQIYKTKMSNDANHCFNVALKTTRPCHIKTRTGDTNANYRSTADTRI